MREGGGYWYSGEGMRVWMWKICGRYPGSRRSCMAWSLAMDADIDRMRNEVSECQLQLRGHEDERLPLMQYVHYNDTSIMRLHHSTPFAHRPAYVRALLPLHLVISD